MPLPKFVHLTRPPQGLRPRRAAEAIDTNAEAMWIFTIDPDGLPVKIARSYVDRLRDVGWQGVDDIPAVCIVEDL